MKNKKILVLEDEIPLADAARIKLENNGFDVLTARTVSQGLDYLGEIGDIDAIWLDHYLIGKENGLDFLAKVKEGGSKYQHTPVFVVSNTASDEKVSTYLRLGINKYFVKSDHKLSDIVESVSQAVNSHE